MFVVRRAALRAASSASRSLLSTPRASRSFTTRITLPQRQPITASLLQKRFISEEVPKENEEKQIEEKSAAIAEAAEESPIEAAEAVSHEISSQPEVADVSPTDAAGTVTQYGSSKPQVSAEGMFPGNNLTPEDLETIIYVGNLFFDVDDVQLREQFASHGIITKIRVVRDSRGLSKGFGYVQFESAESAANAVKTLNQVVFEGRRMVVQHHRPRVVARPSRRSAGPTSTLYIGNLSYEMTDQDLNNLFRPLRNVTDVRVAIDRRTGQPRGFAHADFTDVESATKAKEALEERIIHGRALKVDFGSTMARREYSPETRENGGGQY